jgi:predicted HicB family RNase H-like nuclease
MIRFNNYDNEIITRTFRLRKEIDQVLRKEAARQGISVSSYLDEIIKNSLARLQKRKLLQ